MVSIGRDAGIAERTLLLCLRGLFTKGKTTSDPKPTVITHFITKLAYFWLVSKLAKNSEELG